MLYQISETKHDGPKFSNNGSLKSSIYNLSTRQIMVLPNLYLNKKIQDLFLLTLK